MIEREMGNTEIVADRIKLRLIDLSDLDAIHSLHTLPETDKYNTLGIPKNIEETKSVIAPWIIDNQLEEIKNYTFAIVMQSDGKFLGLLGLKLGSAKFKGAEVWYKIHVDYWNKGYATESLKAIIHFGFEKLKLHRIEAGCAIDNIGSIKVLEKAGMTREGHRRKILPLKSGWSDNFEYAILETDKRIKD